MTKLEEVWNSIYNYGGNNDDTLNYLDKAKRGTMFGEFDEKYVCDLQEIINAATEEQLIQMTKELELIYNNMTFDM